MKFKGDDLDHEFKKTNIISIFELIKEKLIIFFLVKYQ